MVRRDLPPGGPGGDPDREVREEIDFHLEERARELEAEGFGPEEARREAARTFGDVGRIEAEVRRIRRGRERDEGRRMMMEALRRDVGLALRRIRRQPGFGATVIGTLALGIGAVTAIFTVVNASLLRDLPFAEAERLVFLQGAYDAADGPAIRGASLPEATDWAAMTTSFDRMAPIDAASATLTGEVGAEQIILEQQGHGVFEMLGVRPTLGRTFTAEEAAPLSGARVAVVSHGLWTRRWGSDPDIVGRTVLLNDEPVTVVGVMPEGFSGPFFQADLWLPMGNPVVGPTEGRVSGRGSRWLSVLARLAPGTTVEDARAEMARLAARLEEEHPVAHEDRIALVMPVRDVYMGGTDTLVLVILAATGLLLVIAAANVANLLLVRASGGGADVHVRKALGAERGRLVRQYLTESVVLSGLGAVLGLGLGVWGARLLASIMPPALLPPYVELTPDPVVFLAAAALVAVVGGAAGLVPAIHAARSDPAPALRTGSGASTRETSRVQDILIVGEVALALLLLVGAALMTRSLAAQLEVAPGYDHEELYAFRVFLTDGTYPMEELPATMREIDRRLEEAPGIERVTYGSDAPLKGGGNASYIYTEGSAPEDRIRFYMHRVAPDWFETLGTDVVRGRALSRSDLADPNVAVVGRELAQRFFPAGDAVGGTIRLGAPDGQALAIVGVAEQVRWRDLTSDLLAGEDDPHVYVTWDSLPSREVDVIARATGEPGAIESTVRTVIRDYDPDMAVYLAAPMSFNLRQRTAQARFGSVLLGVFSGLALVLAVVGLYAVLSFSVDRRRREIAVRLAVGAGAARVRRMIVWQGLRPTAVGLLLGLGAAVIGSRSLDAFLFGVEPVDAGTYASVSALMAAVALAAAWIPALRATRIEPQRALGVE